MEKIDIIISEAMRMFELLKKVCQLEGFRWGRTALNMISVKGDFVPRKCLIELENVARETKDIVKVNVDQMNKKNARHSKIAKEAAEQSHRIKIMEVANLETWKSFIKLSKEYDLCLYAYEASLKDDSFKRILKTKKFKNILILVGPEGGISDKEVEDLKANNFLPITLGPRILRTQVAPLYIMSALSYEWEAEE